MYGILAHLLHVPLCDNVARAHLGRLHHEPVSKLHDNELGELCHSVEQELFWAPLQEPCDKLILRLCDKQVLAHNHMGLEGVLLEPNFRPRVWLQQRVQLRVSNVGGVDQSLQSLHRLHMRHVRMDHKDIDYDD